MATIKVKQASINELRSAIMFAAEQADEAAEMVSKSVNDISDMSFLAKPSLESELTSLKNRLARQARLSRSCCRAVQETVDLIVQVDNLSGTSAEEKWSGVRVKKTARLVNTAAALVSLAVKESLRRRSKINDAYIDGGSDAVVTTTPGTGGNGQNEAANQYSGLPDWAEQYSDICSNSVPASDGGQHPIAIYNEDGVVACTFYTIRRLRERGLGFPFKSSEEGVSYNGGNWFNNCTDDVPKVAGNDAIEALLSGRDSIENVVVSFSPSKATGYCGHVMLIDKVYKDSATGQIMVSSSDHLDFKTGQYLYDCNGTVPAATRTLEAFKELYFANHGGMEGAVLIGS